MMKAGGGSSVHYYSIQDGGVHGTNYNNDGAHMDDSMAVGKNTKTYLNAMAVGQDITVHGKKLTATEYAALSSYDQPFYTKHTEGGVDSYYRNDVRNIAFGRDIENTETRYTANNILIGNKIKGKNTGIMMGDTISDSYGIAIGNNLKEVNGTVIGRNMTKANGIIVGDGNQSQGGIILGTGNDVAGNYMGGSIAIGENNTAKVAQGMKIGTWAEGGSIAIGRQVTATGHRSIGMGMVDTSDGYPLPNTYTKATADDTIALGTYTEATAQEAIAIGKSAIAGTTATSTGSIAIGSETKSDGINSVALGTKAKAESGSGIAIGDQAHAASTGGSTIAIGQNSLSSSEQTIALGVNTKASGMFAIAQGSEAQATAEGAIAMGYNAQTIAQDAIAIGRETKVNSAIATGSIAIGRQAATNSTHDIAIGQESSATGSGGSSIAIGYKTTSKTDSVAIGSHAEGNSQFGVAIGVAAKAKKTGGTEEANIAIGYSAESSGERSIAIGDKGSLSGTPATKASGNDAIAIGSGAIASAEKTISIGYQNNVSGARSTAIGDPNTITGTDSEALGNNNTIGGNNAQAVGNSNNISANNSAAVGNNNTITGTDTYVLGSGVTAGVANSVVLGKDSTVETPVSTANTTINGKTYTFAGGAAAGTVSVGKAGGERTITHLAAGRISATSTDAINGSQLWSTNDNLERVKKEADGNLAALGGGAAYNINTNTYTAPTYNVTDNNGANKTVHNVGDAIDALGQGWTLKDTATGTKTVKAGSTVTVTGDTYIKTTVNASGLNVGIDQTKLQTNINNAIDNSTTIKNLKAGFNLKSGTTTENVALGGATPPTVEFAVADDTLTVGLAGGKVTYGIDKTKLASKMTGDIITNINNATTPITNAETKFKIADGTNPAQTVKADKTGSQTVTFVGDGNIIESEVTGGNVKYKVNTTNLNNAINNNTTVKGNTTNITKLTADVANKADKDAGNITGGDITSWQNKLGITTLNAGFNVKAGTNTGAIKAGDTLEFAGKNYVEASYDTTSKKVTVGLDNATKTKIDNISSLIGGKAKWTIMDSEAVPGSKQIDAATPLVVKGEDGITAKVDASGLKLGLDGTTLNNTINNSATVINNVEAKFKIADGTNPAQTVKADKTGSQTVTFVGDGNIIESEVTGGNVKYKVNTTNLNNAINNNTTVKGNTTNITKLTADVANKADKDAGNITGGDITNWQNKLGITNLTNQVNAGWELDVEGSKVKDVTPTSKKVNFKKGANINITGAGDDITIGTTMTPTFTSVTTGGTVINNGGLTVGGHTYVSSSGINANNQRIQNVADATSPSDAINKSQLDAAILSSGGTFGLKAQDGNSVIKALKNTIDVVGGTIDASATYSGNNLTTAVDGGKIQVRMTDRPKFGNVNINDGGTGKITGVTGGSIAAGSTEVITGDQLHTVNQQVIKNTTNITKNTTNIAKNTTSITNLQNNVAGKADKNAGNLSAGDVTNWQNKLGISALQAGFRVKAGGNQGTVKAGQTLEFVGTNHVETSYNSTTRTVTVGLDATAKGKIDNLDNIIAGKASWTIQDAEAVQGKKTINAMTPLTVKGENGVTTKVDAGGLKIGLKPVVTIGSSHPVTIDGNNGTVTGLTNKTWTGSIVSGRAATEDQLAAAMSSIGPVGATVVKGSGNITAVKTVGKNEYTVALKDDIKVKSIDTKTVKVEGKTYINSTGIHANDQKISNVKDGEIKKGGTDAVTGGQLYETNKAVSQIGTAIGKVGNELMRVDRKVNKVGAGAAALAALHPQEYDPEDKWGFAAGFGNYRNAHAVAIGAFYRPNENTLVNIGTTMGDAANMFNAGVSVKLGQGSGLPISRTAMAREINTLHGQLETMRQRNDQLEERNDRLEKENEDIKMKLAMIMDKLNMK